jgi:6-phosphofructokinase
VAMLVSDALEYYFYCLSNLCCLGCGMSMEHAIEQVLARAENEEVGRRYREKVRDAKEHPLNEWDVKKMLLAALKPRKREGTKPEGEQDGTSSGDNDSSSDSGPESFNWRKAKLIPSQRSWLCVPPFKFEIRPHRTDYLPRSGPPSSYDYKLATVLGQKVGEMLLDQNREFGAVPALEQVVSYEELNPKTVKTVQIDEIRTLKFDSPDYFDPEHKLHVTERITEFFRTILSGPEDLEKAIRDNPPIKNE